MMEKIKHLALTSDVMDVMMVTAEKQMRQVMDVHHLQYGMSTLLV